LVQSTLPRESFVPAAGPDIEVDNDALVLEGLRRNWRLIRTVQTTRESAIIATFEAVSIFFDILEDIESPLSLGLSGRYYPWAPL